MRTAPVDGCWRGHRPPSKQAHLASTWINLEKVVTRGGNRDKVRAGHAWREGGEVVLVLAICSWATRIRSHHKLLVAADGRFHCSSRSCGDAIDHHLHLLQQKPNGPAKHPTY